MDCSAASPRGSSRRSSPEQSSPEQEQAAKDSEAHVERLRAEVEEALAALEPREAPALLYDPVRYVLSGDGKRLRPLLLLLTAEAFGEPPTEAMPAALAVEVFHNFTLVHDDIMDRAEHRRGRPAVHRRWDTGTALLAGDLLLVRAYDLLSEGSTPSVLLTPFRRMARRLCEGQALDKAFETQAGVSVEDYLHMIDGKTGALLSATLEMGALAGGASEAEAEALREAGAALGRAFQIQDDLLDLTADDERWGKPVGADLVEGKKTFLLLSALERADDERADDERASDDRAFFARVAEEGGLPPEEVPEARRRMRRLGVLEEARQAVARHTEAARERLRVLPDRPAAGTLRWLIGKMQNRLH